MRDEVVGGQWNPVLARIRQQRGNVPKWNGTARAAAVSRHLPFRYSDPSDAGYFSDTGRPTKGLDYGRCWFHDFTYRISKQSTQAKVSISQADERVDFRYNGHMKKHQVVQWLNDALAYSGIKQAELTRALAARGVIDDNRSIVNKMAKGDRDISVEELFAISEITGHPIPAPGGEDEIARLMLAIRAAPQPTQDQIISVVKALLNSRPTP